MLACAKRPTPRVYDRPKLRLRSETRRAGIARLKGADRGALAVSGTSNREGSCSDGGARRLQPWALPALHRITRQNITTDSQRRRAVQHAITACRRSNHDAPIPGVVPELGDAWLLCCPTGRVGLRAESRWRPASVMAGAARWRRRRLEDQWPSRRQQSVLGEPAGTTSSLSRPRAFNVGGYAWSPARVPG